MWCNLMCLHFMWCDFLCCVMSRNAPRCHVMSSHVMSCHLLWSDAVQWDEILWVCDAMWLVAMSRCVVRSGCVGWIGRWSGDPYYTVLQSTTPVLLCTTKYYSSTNSVLQSTTPVLLCTTKYYSSTNSVLQSTTPVLLRTTKYYKVLVQYYLFCTTKYYSSTNSVLQSTTPVLLCTTKYYSSTRLYYKVLLQYYTVLLQYYSSTNSVLQSTTPVLLCTTQIYSSTTLYYKVLLQYYSVLQSTTPVLLLKYAFARRGAPTSATSRNAVPATQSDSHDWSSSHMKRHLQCAEQRDSSSNVTKYCTCHAKWLSWVMSVTYETSFTMRGATGVIHQRHHACHAKWLSWVMSVTYETSFTVRGATGVIHQRHQVLCLPRKMTRIIDPCDIWNVIYNARSNRHHPPTSPNAVPATKNDSHHWSSWRMKRNLQSAEQQDSSSNVTKYCTWHAKWLSWVMSVTYETSFTMRGATGLILQRHQIAHLPRKMTLMSDVRHIWNVIYNARSNRCHPPTSPSTVPATRNDSHEWCPSHMKRPLQCAEQQASPSNLTRYCACHAKLHSKI